MIKAKEAEMQRLAYEKSATKGATPETTAARKRRAKDRAPKKPKEDEWLAKIRQQAENRRFLADMHEDEIGMGWEDAFDANIAHLTTLLEAQRAATDAEEAMQRANSADPVDPASMGEARRLKDHADRLAELDVQQREIYEGLRAKVTAKAEAHPTYRTDPDWRIVSAFVTTRCPVCLLPHPAAICPYLFEDRVELVVRSLSRTASTQFRMRWNADAQFREAILYLRSKFSRAPGSNEIMPLRRRGTIDAPPSAIRKSPVSLAFKGHNDYSTPCFAL